MARPRKEIDKNEFEKLCYLQCTQLEICEWFNVTDKTLTNWCKRTYHAGFSEVYHQKRAGGKVSLRRAQFRLAEKSASMAIWLGKVYLGQQETVAVDANKGNNLLEAIKGATVEVDTDEIPEAE